MTQPNNTRHDLAGLAIGVITAVANDDIDTARELCEAVGLDDSRYEARTLMLAIAMLTKVALEHNSINGGKPTDEMLAEWGLLIAGNAT